MAKRTKFEIMEGVKSSSAKIIGNNTVEYVRPDGTRVVRLHRTDILEFEPDGAMVLNSGGWRTVTTKDRINRHLTGGWQVIQERGIWYLSQGWKSAERYVFEDGMKITAGGEVKDAGREVDIRKINKQINDYVKGFMEKLKARELEPPGGGDCWDCLFKYKDGRNMGDLSGSGHILSHLREKYHVSALLQNAVEELPVSKVAMHCIGYWWKIHEERAEMWEGIAEKQVAKSMKRYLKRRLGIAA